MKLTPAKVKIEKKCFPAELNKGDAEGSFLGRLEHKTGKDCTDITAGFAYGMPKLADNAALWVEGNVVSNNCKEFAGDLSAVVGYNNQYFIGSKILANLKTQKLNEAHGFLAADFDKNFVYMNTNCLERKIKFGFSTPNVEYLERLAGETQIELDDKHQLKGTPTSTIALSHKVNDDSKIKVKFDITKDIHTHFSFIHKISKNLTLTVTDYCNPIGFFKNSGKETYKLGVSLEANL